MAPDTPPIADLLAGFLARHAEDRAAGIPESPGHDAIPHEAAAFPMVEPRVAWDEALQALQLLDGEKSNIKPKPPADWANIVMSPITLSALPFASGNFPQLVRDLPALLKPTRRSDLQPKPEQSLAAHGAEIMAAQAIEKRQIPEALAAIGALRLARQFDTAIAQLESLRPHVPARWQTAFANEEAALAWQQGDAVRADAMWANLPESAPVLFNRGMSALFSDRPDQARAELTKAIALLSEDNAWHHLARLYLAMAQM